MKGMNNQP